MAGHSKWKNIQHRKGRQDAAKAKLFTKISKEIYQAARAGGADPNTNPRLKHAIAKAKDANIPSENIERTIKKATGQLDGVSYEEIIYEGYGPGGVAVMVEALTDNRNRTAADVRHIFTKNGGNLGESGCVSFMFDRKGIIEISRENKDLDEDSVMMAALDAGAEDFEATEESFEIKTTPEDFETVRTSLEEAGYELDTAEISMIPQNTVKVTGEDAEKMLKLVEMLESNDDVQDVYTNFDIDEEELEKMQ
ncbi:YebC/PmpR family DNA-binding transcriptional regulator [Aneurinibacillus thermoaerophilus]|jgi:YebC/PmpR family DNA-binding regulatory protein|uniref:Probable transcriptional regulatory protein K3F53_14635 n=1 Tax=Aneurinibacillus thermoaerophilus TaxID=143495 RepID=A0A1G7Y9M3_ANETH|nr:MULTISPECIES: YebC/PmpR family DNA-binding transcriptional regulator [Aneurinibacillus]AMA72143.1 transcriptional regulator [Aneurinibacillus sp. XH2]MED0676428.1 YebC/PmpR family DNA-binding transcriptional regulator [Aneurinibacillus thermoaerophilus]MED0678940.1 YebC/PmpR family DNA-binding transcriptional regulator [Aneurinibacillus thermoaerophilus]MED0755980.1 YebC/PmpR family DNA-binding transcriptional regulator [Aneurinibacillus thermoaerophilus]MED0759696.1 YebC/PmpR family DNA-bi